jgi:hypothetical protein
MSDTKPDQFDETLTGVAESIGSTLGVIAAKATAAKEALTPSSATKAKVVRKARAVQRSAKAITRKVTKKVSAGAKKAKKAAGKTKAKAKKVAKKVRRSRR